jgi:HNH endonuclease
MKKCIWCCRTEETATFITKAHTIPQSIGGKFICENVCDKCNDFFGDSGNRLLY